MEIKKMNMEMIEMPEWISYQMMKHIKRNKYNVEAFVIQAILEKIDRETPFIWEVE